MSTKSIDESVVEELVRIEPSVILVPRHPTRDSTPPATPPVRP